MPDEPDNLTLQLLREIRADIGDLRTRFDRIDARIERVENTLQLIFNVIVDLNARLTRLETEKT